MKQPRRCPRANDSTERDIVTDIFIEGGRVLIGDEMAETSLRIAGREIAAIGADHGRGSLASMQADCWCCRASSICTAMPSSGR